MKVCELCCGIHDMSVLGKGKERRKGMPHTESRVNLTYFGSGSRNIEHKRSTGSPRGKYTPRKSGNNTTKVVTSVVDVVVHEDDR